MFFDQGCQMVAVTLQFGFDVLAFGDVTSRTDGADYFAVFVEKRCLAYVEVECFSLDVAELLKR